MAACATCGTHLGHGYARSVSEDDKIAALRARFEERGFELTFRRTDGFAWADLVRASSGAIVSGYGRGDSEATTAARAKERFEQEQ
jgi:hypothetical protein